MAGGGTVGIKLVFAIARQWVRIEEAASVHAHARNHTIIKCALQTVDILALAMQEEHALIEIHLSNGSASLVVGSHVRQLIVGSESLSGMTGTHTAREIILLGNDIVPDAVDSLDIIRITRQGSHISNSGIHISGTHGMSPCLVLLQDRLIALAIGIVDRGGAAGIEEVFSLVEILLFTRKGIEASKCHFGYLMTRHNPVLTGLRTHFPDHTVGISLGNIEEFSAARSLIMGAGCIHHVTEIIKLMAQHFHLAPAGSARPTVRMFRIDSTSGIEISVRLLRSTHHIEHTVDIGLHLLVGIGLQDIAGSLDGLIDIGIIKREAHKLTHVPLLGIETGMSRMLQGIGCHLEILVAVLALALAESQRHSYLSGSLQTRTPKGILSDFHTGKGYLNKGITIVQNFGFLGC